MKRSILAQYGNLPPYITKKRYTSTYAVCEECFASYYDVRWTCWAVRLINLVSLRPPNPVAAGRLMPHTVTTHLLTCNGPKRRRATHKAEL